MSVIPQVHSLRDWSQEIWDVYGALEVVAPTGQPIQGALDRRSLDQLQTVELRASPQSFRRTPSMVASHPLDVVVVTMIVEGQALIVQDGRTCALDTGDLAFLETRRPYSMMLQTSSRVIDFMWPRELFGLLDSEYEVATGRPFKAASPLGSWLCPALVGLHEMREGISQAGAVRVADGISDLLVTAALELGSPDDPDARWRTQYDEIIRYIERNLDAPDLSVDSIADRFFMSKRSVHRLFARFGTTVACATRDIRLEGARQRMLSNSYRTQSVSFIASQLGFSSLQVFSRAFTAKYGVGPKQYRAAYQ